MKIGELSERSGLPASRIRFYEANGLLPEAARAPNGYRDYDASMIGRLRIIDLAKSLGFSLEEIANLLPAQVDLKPSCETVSSALTRKLAAIETHMDKLRETRARIEAALHFMQSQPDGAEPRDMSDVRF